MYSYVCVCVCIYIYTHTCICMCMCVYIYMYMCIHISIYVYIYKNACAYTHTFRLLFRLTCSASVSAKRAAPLSSGGKSPRPSLPSTHCATPKRERQKNTHRCFWLRAGGASRATHRQIHIYIYIYIYIYGYRYLIDINVRCRGCCYLSVCMCVPCSSFYRYKHRQIEPKRERRKNTRRCFWLRAGGVSRVTHR